MCKRLLHLMSKMFNCIAAKCCIFKLKEKYEMRNFQDAYLNCVDKPYGIMSFEILIQIRMLIEATRNPTEKAYYRLLEDFINVLDYLCHGNNQALLISYINDLKEKRHEETRRKLKFMLKLTLTSLKLALKSVDQYSTIGALRKQIVHLEKSILDFCLKNNRNKFVENYCKILYKLPKLALTRRGLALKDDGF